MAWTDGPGKAAVTTGARRASSATDLAYSWLATFRTNLDGPSGIASSWVMGRGRG